LSLAPGASTHPYMAHRSQEVPYSNMIDAEQACCFIGTTFTCLECL